jgi:hypothetical protein
LGDAKISRSLEGDNIIIVGALNVTLNLGEIWEESTRPDPFSNYFNCIFEELKLIDVESI